MLWSGSENVETPGRCGAVHTLQNRPYSPTCYVFS